jgi:hypothetical protein
MTPGRVGRVLLGLAMLFGLVGGGTAYAAPHRDSIAHLTTTGNHGQPTLTARVARDASGQPGSARWHADGTAAAPTLAAATDLAVAPATAPQIAPGLGSWLLPGPRSPPAVAG